MNFDELLKRIRNRLPIQNPLHSYVHNNILLMFENKDFHEAVSEASLLYRARPYWPLFRYREKFDEGKILEVDIYDAIEHYLGRYNNFAPFLEKLEISPKEFSYRLMFSDIGFETDEELPDVKQDHLWELCREKTKDMNLTLSRSIRKWRAKDYWEKYHNENLISSTQPFIIRLLSSYLDQGQSFWTNPFINKGLWNFFLYDVESIKNFTTGWQKNLVKKVKQYETCTSQEVVEKELKAMGIPEEEWEGYLLNLLFDLKGWSGMVNKLELEPWQATVKSPSLKLTDYIAILLLVESSLDTYHAQAHSLDLSLIYGRAENVDVHSYQLAMILYQVSVQFKLRERWMQRLTTEEITQIIDGIDQACHVDKIRLWHEAYEHHFYREALSAIVQHSPHPMKVTPYAQALFCIDDREESIRRHVEEVDPEIETYGVVGFFGVDMRFAGLKNQKLIAQCPPVMVPSRIVREVRTEDHHHKKPSERINRFLGASGLSLYYHSRTLFRGFIATLLLGTAAIFPMFLQVFFPKHSQLFRRWLKNLVSPEPHTELILDKGEGIDGYSKEEMANIVQGTLRMCGLKEPFARLVVMMGHGASSTNNPFRQAYGCGACGGNAGMPNSRAFAKMGNDEGVRKVLSDRGIKVPADTHFISAFHDTTTDEIHLMDLESLPATHKADLERFRKNTSEAAKLNAFERCQRFSSAEAKMSPQLALKHVRERAEDLAQPRPEYGHCTTAIAIVGKRDLTRGLFLNRRSFLISYDWQVDDDDGALLFQAVIGAIPVAVNINMDYYFSCVDNDNFGCGSKLPLNLTGLLGVMTGSQSDLRIGLARQMVEVHEPIRNITILEAPLARVQKIFDSHPRLRNIMYHHWTRVAVFDPQVKQWYIFGQTEFKLLNTDKFTFKHFDSSKDLIDQVHNEENFAEIGHD
jgi:uncharacterized protein